MNNRTKGLCLAAIGALLWGASGVAAQYLFHQKGFSPEFLVVIRLLVSGFLLLGIDGLLNFGDIFTIWHSSYDRLQLLLFGIIGMLSVQYTYFAAISCSNAATATVLQYLMPVIIVFWISLRDRRLPHIYELLAIALAMLGTLLLVTKGDFTTLAISKAALFWGILAALSAAFYTLQPKYLLQHWRSPLVIGWGMLLGGIVMLVLSGFDRGAAVFDLEATTALAFVVCFGTILAFWSYLESIKYIRPTETSTLGSLEPLAAVLLSVLLLDIPFGPFDAGGSLLMMLAVCILSRLKR